MASEDWEGNIEGEEEVERVKVATPLPLPPPIIDEPLGLKEGLGVRVELWVSLGEEEEVRQAVVEKVGEGVPLKVAPPPPIFPAIEAVRTGEIVPPFP